MKLQARLPFVFLALVAFFATKAAAQAGLSTMDRFAPIGEVGVRGPAGGACGTVAGPSCIGERAATPIGSVHVGTVPAGAGHAGSTTNTGSTTTTDEGGVEIRPDPLQYYFLKRQVALALLELRAFVEGGEMKREDYASRARLLVQRARAAATRYAEVEPAFHALMPPEGWTIEYFRALNRLEALVAGQEMKREVFQAMVRRLSDSMLASDELE